MNTPMAIIMVHPIILLLEEPPPSDLQLPRQQTLDFIFLESPSHVWLEVQNFPPSSEQVFETKGSTLVLFT